MWIDIGANLTHESFRADLDAVLRRATAAEVGACILTGTSVDGSRAARALASERAGLWSTAGVHPHSARDWGPAAASALEELAAGPEVVALGECGLDFHRDFSPRPDQERAFREQLELAAARGLPVFLHERDAHERFAAILGEFRAHLPAAVIHCFTGEAHELDRYLEMDLHVGITGWICDERRGLHLRELVGRIPPGRLMIETDSPYLLPRDLRPRPRSRRNEPAHLAHVAAAVAACRGEELAVFEAHVEATTRAFFGLPEGPALRGTGGAAGAEA